MQLKKPKRLNCGDRVAIVSPSWGGPSALPEIYALGRRAIEEQLGLAVVEMPHALADPVWLSRNPEARADDLHAAFADPSIQGVIASIGGEDSIGLIPHLDLEAIAKNPKVFLGFSAVTSIHFACMKAGLTSFYGPNIMPCLAAQGATLAYAVESLKRTLFESARPGRIEPNPSGWTERLFELVTLDTQNAGLALHPKSRPRVLQGSGKVSGPLIGGCAEVLQRLKGTAWWPSFDAWYGSILFYETFSATPDQMAKWLRDIAAERILHSVSGVIIGRPGAVTAERHNDYDSALMDVLAETGLGDLPVISNMDFGHTDPAFVLPYGVVGEIDCGEASFSLMESGVERGGV